MAKNCAICRGKPKFRCDYCRNEFCQDHSIKCPSCGTIMCIRELARRPICVRCKSALEICPECLMNGKIVRTIHGGICPECGWSKNSG